MPVDLSLPMRKGVVQHLRAWEPLTDLVSASRIYGEAPDGQPARPFVRYGVALATGYEATCWSGSSFRMTLHAFANGPFSDSALSIGRQIVAAIDALEIEGLSITENEWISTEHLSEVDNPVVFHEVVQFDITAVLVEG